MIASGPRQLVVLAAVLLAVAGPAHGHEGHTHSDPNTVAVTLLDGQLVDRDGTPVRFPSEAIADRIVVIDFVYTRCPTCPIISKAMAAVQDGLDAALRDSVLLISIGVDPESDTPETLAAQAAALGAGPGWLWLTGAKREIDRVLVGLGAYSAQLATRPIMVLVGDARAGAWTRFLGLPDAAQILDKVNDLAAARAPTD